MKYVRTGTSFSVVPKEITLTIEISNCPHHCEGCHSPELCEDVGEILDEDALFSIFKRFSFENKPLFTCLGFMGGDNETKTLIGLIKFVHKKFPEIKICLYTGSETISPELKRHLKYLKTGKYIESLGPLGSPKTNQKFLEI